VTSLTVAFRLAQQNTKSRHFAVALTDVEKYHSDEDVAQIRPDGFTDYV
jgi:hypothetical protein